MRSTRVMSHPGAGFTPDLLHEAPALGSAQFYSDRVRPPADTVAAMRPHFSRLGITRLARQTGLDTIGIPCFAAVRPNARTLAVNMGKGIEDDAAMASAVMEAAEYAIAEAPTAPIRQASVTELRAEGRAVFDVAPWLPRERPLPEQMSLAWLTGLDLFSGETMLVPRDAVSIGGPQDLPDISQSTNGLASGNSAEEATFHALCELVERDATSLWVFRSDAAAAATQIGLENIDDPEIAALRRRIETAGLQLTLFDQTTDLGVPVIFALLAPADGQTTRYFDLAAGCGCHPVAVRAALRAITEAAQTRVSNIAGARDDFDPAEYQQRLTASLTNLLALRTDQPRPLPRGLDPGTRLAALLADLKARLAGAGITRVIAVPLGGEEFGISVIRVLAQGLEDRATNRHWRPGPRATRAMLGL